MLFCGFQWGNRNGEVVVVSEVVDVAEIPRRWGRGDFGP